MFGNRFWVALTEPPVLLPIMARPVYVKVRVTGRGLLVAEWLGVALGFLDGATGLAVGLADGVGRLAGAIVAPGRVDGRPRSSAGTNAR